MNPQEFKLLLNRMDNLQKTVDRLDADISEDRHDREQFAIRLGAMENIVEELRLAIRTNARKVNSLVEDTLAPLSKELKELQETIKSKKTIILKPKKRFFFF